jgi:F-type H+-transporting ATPase subunit b
MKIDWWTLGFQTVNIVVLVWLLKHFFWSPVAAMIAQRVEATRKVIDDAAAKTKAAQDMLAGFVQTREGFGAERAAILQAAHVAADKDRDERVAEAAQQASALLAKAKTQAERDARAAEKAWTDRAGHLAVQIAERLLGGLDGAALRTAFLGRLRRQLQALQPKDRAAIAGDGAALDAVSAEALDPAEQLACSSAIFDALQSRPQLNFKVDPTLIAGLELRAPHAVVSNSLHADLDRILLELTHDDAN